MTKTMYSMKSIHFQYQDYTATVYYDASSQMWHGRINNIRDVVSFEGNTQAQAEKEFRKSVEGYLAFCHALGRSPNLPT